MNFPRKINVKLDIGLILAAIVCFLIVSGILGVNIQASLAKTTNYTCSNATLKGPYGHYVIGTKGTEAPFVPYIVTRTATFDGKGHSYGHGFSNIAGTIKEYSVTATYHVNPDCTFKINNKALFEDGSGGMETQHFGVIVDSGRKIYGIHTSPGRTVSVYYERMN